MPNRLAKATSPYLLQHKDNPVDWHEWSEEAFAEARSRDVPLLLSVGYAACHWCHVMAHESFEDPETAALMNRLFVNVKVDREERPDVDSIYMEAVQTMTGRGGWPMTVWLDHDGRPFYAGTYYPKTARHGMPGFKEVITAIAGAWRVKRDEVEDQASQLVNAISVQLPSADLPGEAAVQAAFRQIAAQFDEAHGGLGGAPKFPQQPLLEFLLRIRSEPWAEGADDMLATTLEAMAAGGIHDQLGGGFARYSVDDRWLVPHFEKMLYDNTQLARLYLWAGVELGRDDLLAVARSTLDYMLRDLRHPDGGFFSSEDADSEGVEGKFYVWSIEDMQEILGPDSHDVLDYYGVTPRGNFEGANILTTARGEPPLGIEEARRALLEARSARVRPGLDDKVISSWNGLAIRALAEAGGALGDEAYLAAAADAASFVDEHLTVDGLLMRSWREGRTSVPGFLDDHASIAVGLFSLYAATGDIGWYRKAMTLVGRLESFRGPDGELYATSSDGELLIKRPRDHTDNPLPSGNALAAEALLLASLYTGEQELRAAAEQTLGAVGVLINRYPTMVGHHLCVLQSMAGTRELAIVGPEWQELSGVYWRRFRPHIALAGSTDGGAGDVPLLEGRYRDGETLAYVCQGFVCELPTTDPGVLSSLLS